MNAPLLNKLEEFGLSEKEAKVYLASLELGEATAEQIAKHSEVNRSTTYVQIQELMRMGLMSTHEKGKKTFFTAESPDNLKRLFERKKQEIDLQAKALDAFVPELMRLHDSAGERPVVRFFEGKEGLITMRKEVLKTKEKDIYMAFSFDDLWELFKDDMDELYAWSAERARKKICSHIIYTKTGSSVDPVEPQKLRRVDAKNFPFESDIYIFGDKIAMASLKGAIVGVIIESKSLAKSLKSIFMLAWQTADNGEAATTKSKPIKK